MPGQEERKTAQSNLEVIDSWIGTFIRKEFAEVDPQILKSALTELGANFEVEKEALEALGSYTNKAKRPGLDGVWGEDRVEEFKRIEGARRLKGTD